MSEESPRKWAEDTVGGESPEVAPREPEDLARGDVIGRYVVLEKLGAGGMGVVYAAYDPELDRRVALKVLRSITREGSTARARLLREAQALAKLSHPNVVAVYDAGVVDRRVWLAMELVVGKTLRRWLDDQARSWRDVLGIMIAAGRGLAAAHAAGLVHRDFKPDNVMVLDAAPRSDGDRRANGRVRVMDFGLARATSDASTPARDTKARPRIAALNEAMTAPGIGPGSPAYMAAEQLGGSTADQKSDQFGFCVTLWEALYGERPFDGDSLAALAAGIISGKLRRPPRGVPIPTWLRVVVQRGLSTKPAKRWPDMAALLDALERGQARMRRRRVWLGVGSMAALGATAFLAHRLDVERRTQACEDAGASIDEVWNAAARERMREAFVATGIGFAAVTAEKVAPWLDAKANAWREARTEACLDHDLRDAANADTFDRAMWCLDERRMELEALVSELADPSAKGLRGAVTVASALPPAQACRDARALALMQHPPRASRQDVADARLLLFRADARARSGDIEEGLALAREARENGEALEWPPIVAAARASEARLFEKSADFAEAERAGKAAYFEAARVGAWDVAADAAIKLIVVVGDRLARYEDGLAWGEHAAIALSQTSDPIGMREAVRLANVANVYYRAGHYADALDHYERSIAIKRAELAPDDPSIAATLGNLAWVHHARGDLDTARELQQQSIEIMESALGPDHPDIAAGLVGLLALHQTRGELDAARALGERAVAIVERSLGDDHPDLANYLTNLALVYYGMGDLDRAQRLHERANALWELKFGAEHPGLAFGLNALGMVHFAGGHHAQALALFERAGGIFERTQGPNHPDVAVAVFNAGRAHAALGAHAKARRLADRALAIRLAALGREHLSVAESLALVAELQTVAGETAEALASLEQAIAIFDANPGEQDGEADARAALTKLQASREATP